MVNQRIFAGLVLMSASVILGGCSILGGLGLPEVPFFGNTGKQLVDEISLDAVAQQDYSGQYQNDAPNKAFAVAPSGEYGVAFGQPSQQQAEQEALRECRNFLQPGSLDCTIYDINGSIVVITPLSLPVYNGN